jgi:outer membrane protein, heavy metal efflux system
MHGSVEMKNVSRSTLQALFFLYLCLCGAATPYAETAAPLTITLSQAREMALRDNPSLRAADAQRRASEGAARQAESLLNPSLEFRREDFGDGRPYEQATPHESFSLTQTVRTAGKRSAERDAARWASLATAEDLRRQTLDLIAEVERSFSELLGAQERVRLSAENFDTASQVASAVSAMVEAGEVSPIEQSRAGNERDLAEIDLQNAGRDVEMSRRKLARLLGQEEPRFERAEGSLATEVVIPDESAATEGLKALPDLRRWDAEAKRLESTLRFAKRSPWPDLTFSVGVRKYTQTQERTYLAGIAFPLPIFNRNSGAIVEAAALLDQGLLQHQAEELRLRSAVTSSRLVVERASAEVRTLGERVMPNAEQIFAAIEEGYRRGKFRLLDLLEARRSLAGARLRYVEALVRLNSAKADMDRLLAANPVTKDGVQP